MSNEPEIAYHLFDERELKDRFLPAIAGPGPEGVEGKGNEPIVREILDAADAAGPHWTALHKVFDECRVSWLRAVELDDGELAWRTFFPAFGRVVTHLRPAYLVRGFDLSVLDREAPEVGRLIVSPGGLLRDSATKSPLPGVPTNMPSRVPARVGAGRSSGGLIMKDDVRGVLEAFRAALPKLVQRLGAAAEPGLTSFLAALVEAKLQEHSILETCEALAGDTHVPKSHRLSFEKPGDIPSAVRREVARLYGRPEPVPPAPTAKAVAAAAAAATAAAEVVTYTPRGTYNVGQRVQHKAFGTGEVTQVLDSRRLKVRFSGEDEKTLIQGQGQS